jgi:ABC-type multidrug transport system ATPase subunit
MELALETRSLRKVFGTLAAVDGIDLSVPRGSFYGFLGPNGAGKSTTIKCLTGLLERTSGEIRILGTDPRAEPVAVKRKIGVVPEDLALFERLSGAETLAFVGRVHGLDAGTLRTRSRELLELMSLDQARVSSSRTTRTECARRSRWRRRCCRRRGCCSSTSLSRASTRSRRGRSRSCSRASSRGEGRCS